MSKTTKSVSKKEENQSVTARDPARQKALESALSQIEKQFGKGSIMKMNGPVEKVPVISTGSLKLDTALGIQGFPTGRIIEIYGPESSGKTTITLQTIAQCQANGGVAAFVDAEHALDPVYAAALGVNLDELLISQPDNGEQALEIVDTLVNSGAIDLVVVDSVAALTPRAELEGDMGDSLPGLQARLMSQALRKITGSISRTKTTVIFINQLRQKIGIMMPGQSNETTTGGNALKFYASVRLDIRRIGSVKKGEDIIGNQVKIKVIKNKMAPPFRVAQTEIMFGEGISRHSELIDLASENGIMEKSGAFYRYNGNVIGQGKENARIFLRDNPTVCEDIETRLRQILSGLPVEAGVIEEGDDV